MAVPIFARKNGGRYKHTFKVRPVWEDKNTRLVYDFPPGWIGCTAHQRISLNKAPCPAGCRAIDDSEGSDLTPSPLHFPAWILRLGAWNEENVNMRAICLTRADPRLWQPPAAACRRDSVHDVQDQAYQPSNFSFPRREFGKSAPVKRAFQASWFNRWKWLHYDVAHLLL